MSLNFEARENRVLLELFDNHVKHLKVARCKILRCNNINKITAFVGGSSRSVFKSLCHLESKIDY